MRGFFERRGREGYAENAEKKYKKNTKLNTKNIDVSNFLYIFVFIFSFLRPLRNLRALCVQKIPAFPSQNLSNHSLVRALVAFVVHPAHHNFVARFGTAKRKLHKRVFRHCRAPLRAHYGFAVAGGVDGLDEVGGHQFAVGTTALAAFHVVADQHAHGYFVAQRLCANSHWITHDGSFSIFIRMV
jgi:hypothetical protein